MRFSMTRTRANSLSALAVYTAVGDAKRFDAYGIMVLRLDDGVVAEITGFGDGDLHRFFDLSDSLDG